MGKQAIHGSLRDWPLWQRMENRRVPLSIEIEATARCPNHCRHCYINRPTCDEQARAKELSASEIGDLGRQAARLGALFCTLTGGEPLLRIDFEDLYLALKRAGLLVSVFTSATLLEPEHVALFQRYPPQELEVTVYGATEEIYERVTRRPGSYAHFRRGVERLERGRIPVRLKAMALRSNLHEFPAISEFCRSRTKDFFRFDTLLHLRRDRDELRNEEIRRERLSAAEIVKLERADPQRSQAMDRHCGFFLSADRADRPASDRLLRCGAGHGKFCITWDGMFQLCSSLCHAACRYDLRAGTLEDAWNCFAPEVREMRASGVQFPVTCGACPIINLCLWCPAHAHLETGSLEQLVPGFCAVAHARARALEAAVTARAVDSPRAADEVEATDFDRTSHAHQNEL